jgi:hypothetical protein
MSFVVLFGGVMLFGFLRSFPRPAGPQRCLQRIGIEQFTIAFRTQPDSPNPGRVVLPRRPNIVIAPWPPGLPQLQRSAIFVAPASPTHSKLRQERHIRPIQFHCSKRIQSNLPGLSRTEGGTGFQPVIFPSPRPLIPAQSPEPDFSPTFTATYRNPPQLTVTRPDFRKSKV